MAVKVLLDTDIGSDIDDAVCLAYLLAQPECDLLGITTVTGEAEARAKLASVLCKVAGKDIPIYPGAELPLLVEPKQTLAAQATALDVWPHASSFPRNEAIGFLRHTIRANAGEVVLLAIGPLTNVALLFRTDSEMAHLLRGLVLMCGQFYSRTRLNVLVEWNASCDPHAAAIIYSTPVPVHRSVGLDVTTQVKMKATEVRERFHHPLLRPVLDFAEVWFQHRDTITFHDPLAAITIFDTEICHFEKGLVEVELESKRLAGFTHWNMHWSETGSAVFHEVATSVNAPRFFEQYFSVFK